MNTEATLAPPLAGFNTKPFIARIPGSKSYTNRALILAAQRMGSTLVSNGLLCDDTMRLATALNAFDGLSVTEVDGGFAVERTKSRLGAPEVECNMGGAGTPARVLMAFAASVEGATVVTGNARLCERPMGDLIEALQGIGVRVECLGKQGCLPVRVHGGTPSTREWRIHGGISSQFTTALVLLAAQQPTGPIRIEVDGHQVSKPYVDMTLAMLTEHGISARRSGNAAIEVEPGVPRNEVIRVEPDASGMSYYLAAAALTGTTVEIPGIDARSAQGDVGLAAAFARMGCEVDATNGAIRITGRPLRGIEIDMDTMPDVVLTLAAVAPFASSPTRITGIANLRVKECDRIHAAAAELGRLGVRVEEGPDWLVIHPCTKLRPARIETYDDHRVAMCFAILGLVSPGVTILDPACVKKSFPQFWVELDRFRVHHELVTEG